MLKKLGIVTVGVTAGLVAAAPFASASESHHHGSDDCNVSSETNNIGQERCNTTGQHNGEGNTLNGTELPTLPAPAVPDAEAISDIVNGVVGGLPDLSNVPVQV
ncbi:hypothetical protein ACR9E3_06000 [Actinomycetospora sp. C-140]